MAMDTRVEIADPTDWLESSVPTISDVESPLHCQVCKDFYNTPMMTSCSHTFCSLCIRKCLTEDGKCPACRAEDQQLKLRRNGVIEEVVDAFKRSRPLLLELARPKPTNGDDLPRKRRRTGDHKGAEALGDNYRDDESEGSSFETQQHPRRSTRRSSKRFSQAQASTDESDQLDDKLSACPICGKRMKEEAVFAHLDVHNDVDATLPTNGHSSPPLNPYFRGSAAPTPKNVPEPLPQMNYSLMKDQPLRKKMSELGIRVDGPRQQLIKRHKEWVNLVNANSDSRNPRSKRELLREMDVWDSTQGRQISGTSAGPISQKEFDGKAWAANHSVDFKRLIAEARSKARQQATPEDETSTKNDQPQAGRQMGDLSATHEPPAAQASISHAKTQTIQNQAERSHAENPVPMHFDLT